MNYMIFVDGSADVDLQAVGEENIKFIPMEYSLAGEMRVCDTMQDRQTLKDFYNGQRRGDLTKTTQISPYMYEEFFAPYMEKGISVLYLALSSGLSSTYNSALMARENLKEKYPDAEFVPVDSLGGYRRYRCFGRARFEKLPKGYDNSRKQSGFGKRHKENQTLVLGSGFKLLKAWGQGKRSDGFCRLGLEYKAHT